MRTCCGQEINSNDALLKFCREHCKDGAGCWGKPLDQVMLPIEPRKINWKE